MNTEGEGAEGLARVTAPVVHGFEVTGRVGEEGPCALLEARTADGDPVALRPLTEEEAAALVDRVGRLAALDEEHLVAVRGLAHGPGASYLVTERVEAASLADLLDRGQVLVVGQVLGVARAVLLGLAHAHERGVVHGRVAPAAVLLGTDGTVRLTGFGLGRPAPAYLAPEAVRHPGAELTRTADVYGVAALLVHLLTGQPLSEQKRHLRAVDATLRTVLSKALSKAPADRHPDAQAFLNALGRAAKRAYGPAWWTEAGLAALAGQAVPEVVALDPPPPTEVSRPAGPSPWRRRVLVGGAVAVVLAGGGVATIALGDEPPRAPASLRTDQFCDEVEADVVVVAGTGTDARFDSSGARATGQPSGQRASATCWWGNGASRTVVTLSVGAAAAVEQAGATDSEQVRAQLDNTALLAVRDAGRDWDASYATRCRDLDDHGYDTAFSCLAPPVRLARGQQHPGVARVVHAVTELDQVLVCSVNRPLASPADVDAAADLDAAAGDLCATVLQEVRRD
ncbi:protein kinase-like protein [Nocardioides sp. J9]|uniref:protein kinase domain-containing protein n=1 Tax=Nocardioides sp. J9 TaxID=935844 RepID=UPI0011A5645D|nr:protein kinase [Nocardioides sp. J9]TWH04932.1 protein kinase-like protein [Nocardioides sp. J9]